MPNVNPGPASLITPQTAASLIPFNANAGAYPNSGNALRLIAVYRDMPVSGVGDVLIPVVNASVWAPATVVITNSKLAGVSGSVAAATLSINTGPAVTGTSIRASAPLTNNTAATAFIAAASATVNLAVTAQTIYANVTVAVATGTVDVFVYGYDASPYTP